MANRGVLDFNSRRCRFRQAGDANFTYGWTKCTDWHSINVLTQSTRVVEVDETCEFEVFGELEVAAFAALLRSVGRIEQGEPIASNSSRTAVCQATEILLEFKIAGPITFTKSSQAPRKLAHNYQAMVLSPVAVNATILDVSDWGIGAITPHRFEPNDMIELAITSSGHELRLVAEIRYSRPEPSSPGMFRSGMKIADLNRLEFGRWRKFVSDL